MGGLIRATVLYSQIAADPLDRKESLEVARRVADYLITLNLSNGGPLDHLPPTYSTDVDKPTSAALSRTKDHWLLVPAAVDAALGYLDLYGVTKEAKYLQAASDIADTYVRTQEPDGTWPLMADLRTGKAVRNQRLIPTTILSLVRSPRRHAVRPAIPWPAATGVAMDRRSSLTDLAVGTGSSRTSRRNRRT